MNNLRKTAWVVGEVLLVLSFLCGYAARYVHPDHLWWLQLVAPFVPYLGIALIGIAAFAVLTRRWRRVALYVPLGVLIGFRFAPTLVWAEGDNAAALSIMTLNDQFVNYVPRAERREEVNRFLAVADPDLVCLQEVEMLVRGGVALGGSSSIAGFLFEKGYTIAARSMPAGEQYKMAHSVVGRVEMGPATEIRLDGGSSSAGRPDASSPTYVTRVPFVWNEETFALYNVHLWSFEEKVWAEGDLSQRMHRLLEYRKDYGRRAREAEALRMILEEEERPFVVCGDLNSTPHNWVYHHIASGLYDAFEAGGLGLGNTFPQQYPAVRIDYVFFSPGLEVASAFVGDLRYSDHLPVVARGSLR